MIEDTSDNAQKATFRYDLNFLKFPLWSVNDRTNEIALHLTEQHGSYSLFSIAGLPTLADIKILYYLLYKLYKYYSFESFECRTTRYEIAKNIFPQSTALSGSYVFNRVVTSLRKWSLVKVEFNGNFCTGGSYVTRSFNIIQDINICYKKREVFVRFDTAFIEQLRESKMHKYINADYYKLFDSALAMRLYELLLHRFENADAFSLDVQYLAKKLTLSKRAGRVKYYPSDVLFKLEKALEELNKQDDVACAFYYCKATATCFFLSYQLQRKRVCGRSVALCERIKLS